MNLSKIFGRWIFLMFALPAFAQNPTDNLAFKLMEKKAAEYEQALGDVLNKNLSKYIAEDRFHISVRIYWNPEKISQASLKNSPLEPKKRKLPGFPIFLSEDQQSLDYYLGTGNVMRLQVNVLLDNSLPENFVDFVKQFIPIQARFVAERGDSLKIIPVEFPGFLQDKTPTPAGAPEGEIPLAQSDLSATDYDTLKNIENSTGEPTLIHPVILKYMLDYEKYLKQKIGDVLVKYIERKDFLVDVVVNWNKQGMAKLQQTLFVGEHSDKVKLPGFKLYLEKQKETFEIISNSRALLKLNVSVLLDNRVPRKTAQFISKIIPLSMKFYPERGDTLKILFDEFPENPADRSSNKDLASVEKETLQNYDESLDATADAAEESLAVTNAKGKKKTLEQLEAGTKLDVKTSQILLQARQHYYGDNLNLALEKVLHAIEINPDSAMAYEMLGSIYYRLNWEELALKNWQISLEINPGNSKLSNFMNRIQAEQTSVN